MGFLLENVHKLVFTEFGEPEEGDPLTLMVRPMSLDTFFEIKGEEITDQDSVQILTDHLVSWNLQRRGGDGTPEDVPATREEIGRLDAMFVFQLVKLWGDRMAAVPAPLDDGSTSGQASQEASIPMETR
jgi:hypothetical protein